MSVWAGIKQHFVSKLWSSTNYARHQTLGIHFFVGFWIGVQILLPSLALSDKEHALEQGICILNSELQYVGDQVRYGGANCPSKPAMKKKEKKWKAGSIFGVRLLAWNLLRATSQNAVSSLTCCETTYWESPSPDTDQKQCFYRILPETQHTLFFLTKMLFTWLPWVEYLAHLALGHLVALLTFVGKLATCFSPGSWVPFAISLRWYTF